MPKLKDVAKEANVSLATALLALNDSELISWSEPLQLDTLYTKKT